VTSHYEIDLPLWKGKPPLTMNQRLHWRQRAERTRKLRSAAAWAAKALQIGQHEHISVQLHYATGDNRRRDSDNLVPTMKPAVDGLVDAGLVVDDDPKHVTTIMPTIHTGPGKRRLWITVDLHTVTGGAA
jgi:crossover junction endodeoxyribonuclease RusA